MKLRQGRHNKRIVYYQVAAKPADTDPMVAVFFEADEAALVVALVNLRADGPWWDEFLAWKK